MLTAISLGMVATARAGDERVEKWSDAGGVYSSSGVSRIDAQVSVGSVEVIAEDRGDVQIVSTREGGDLDRQTVDRWKAEAHLEIRRDDDLIALIDHTPNHHQGRCPSLKIKIRVPKRLALTVHADVGAVVADGDFSDINIKTEVGAVTFHGRCAGPHFNVQLETGAVLVRLAGLPPDEIDLRANVGRISLSIPGDANARVQLETGRGSVDCDLPFEGDDDRHGRPGGSLKGTINGGGDRNIRVSTNIGSVILISSEEHK
jgi:hypothetical protein